MKKLVSLLVLLSVLLCACGGGNDHAKRRAELNALDDQPDRENGYYVADDGSLHYYTDGGAWFDSEDVLISEHPDEGLFDVEIDAECASSLLALDGSECE